MLHQPRKRIRKNKVAARANYDEDDEDVQQYAPIGDLMPVDFDLVDLWMSRDRGFFCRHAKISADLRI